MRAMELLEMNINERKQSNSMVCLENRGRDGADGVALDTAQAGRLSERRSKKTTVRKLCLSLRCWRRTGRPLVCGTGGERERRG